MENLMKDKILSITDEIVDIIKNSEEYKKYIEVSNKMKDHKEIMTLRYGLNNTDELTQKEVAEILGISQSYISRIEKKVIRRLKNLIKN